VKRGGGPPPQREVSTTHFWGGVPRGKTLVLGGGKKGQGISIGAPLSPKKEGRALGPPPVCYYKRGGAH